MMKEWIPPAVPIGNGTLERAFTWTYEAGTHPYLSPLAAHHQSASERSTMWMMSPAVRCSSSASTPTWSHRAMASQPSRTALKRPATLSSCCSPSIWLDTTVESAVDSSESIWNRRGVESDSAGVSAVLRQMALPGCNRMKRNWWAEVTRWLLVCWEKASVSSEESSSERQRPASSSSLLMRTVEDVDDVEVTSPEWSTTGWLAERRRCALA